MKKVTKNEKKKKYKDKLQKREESLKNDNLSKKHNLFKKEKLNEKSQKQESIIADANSQEINIKIKRRINKKKIALIVILIIAVCVYLGFSVYHLIKNPTDSVMVSEGSISQEETVEGYIIRDETVIKAKTTKMVWWK